MYRKLIILVTLIVTIMISSCGLAVANYDEENIITVQIKGAVKREDIIKVPLGTTTNELLNMIELDKDSDISSLSLNHVLYNNEIVVIPKQSNNVLISINSASIDTLISLPGIGISTATKIVEYRQKYGSFNSLEELMNVSGIGTKKYEKLKELITL